MKRTIVLIMASFLTVCTQAKLPVREQRAALDRAAKEYWQLNQLVEQLVATPGWDRANENKEIMRVAVEIVDLLRSGNKNIRDDYDNVWSELNQRAARQLENAQAEGYSWEIARLEKYQNRLSQARDFVGWIYRISEPY